MQELEYQGKELKNIKTQRKFLVVSSTFGNDCTDIEFSIFENFYLNIRYDGNLFCLSGIGKTYQLVSKYVYFAYFCKDEILDTLVMT